MQSKIFVVNRLLSTEKTALSILFAIMLLASYAHADQSTTGAQVLVSLLNQDPNPAAAGSTVVIRLKVENTGAQPGKNVVFELQPTYPFTIADVSATQYLGDLDAFQTGNNYAQAQYTLKVAPDAPEGRYEVKMRYQFNGVVWITQKFAVSVTNKEFAQISLDQSKLSPGVDTQITFTIANRGSAPLQNLAFSWTEPTGAVLPVFSDNTKYVKFLDVGNSVNITYDVVADVNAKPGLYQLQMVLKFESMTNTTLSTTRTQAGILVGGQTDFEVAFSESSQGQTSLSVANIGNNPAMSVSVNIPDQLGYRVVGSNSAIIGNLDKGDYTIVSFQIASLGNRTAANTNGAARTATAAARNTNTNTQTNTQTNPSQTGARPNSLRVIVQYTDTTGQRQSIEKQVPIQFRGTTATGTTSTTGTTRQSSTNWYLLIGLVLAGLAGGYFYGRRRNKQAGIKK